MLNAKCFYLLIFLFLFFFGMIQLKGVTSLYYEIMMKYYSIASVSVNDSGVYHCNNSHGQSKAVKVQVLGKEETLFSQRKSVCAHTVEGKSLIIAIYIIFYGKKLLCYPYRLFLRV